MGKRAAGILMPISSLPSDYGIGCFSKSAYEFVDWLKEAGQTYWQILPLGPTSYGDSPYQSFSTFAGNPYFIDLDTLVEEGVLDKKDCEKVNWGKKPDEVDYEKIYKGRYPLLRKAYGNSDISRFSRLYTLFGLNTRSSSTSNSFAVRLISLPAINTRLPSQSIRRSPT